jgi:hypothetical protein
MKKKFLSVGFFIVILAFALSASGQTACAPPWQAGMSVTVGQIVSFNGDNWKAIQAEISAAPDWQPPNVPALWSLVGACQASGGATCTAVPVPPTGLVAGNIMQTGASLSWTPATPPNNCTVTQYTIFQNGASIGTTSNTAFAVTGLTAGSMFSFTVAASDAAGISAQSAAVSVTTPANTSAPDFSLSATPASQSVPAGGSTSYTVSVASVNGFSGSVSLSVNGLPSGATAAFSPSAIGANGSATLTISTASTTPAGNDTLTVTGTSGTLRHNTQESLTVTGGAPAAVTTGTIHFHLLLGVGSPQDSISLDGDNFTDLIMSNMIAGVMYGHLIQEYAPVPGVQFNKDYLYGSVMGQLLQENLATQDYVSSSNLIDPSPDQQAVMGAGQGGPYQINNYAVDLVAGSTAPAGHSLINYIAIQKNIGFTMANAANQFNQVTPPSFNNKFYGPMLPAFFHYNDFVSLNVIGKGAGAFTPPWQPQYDAALNNFVHLPNSFLDVILNVAYNQGYYGGLTAQLSTQGVTATPSTVTTVNAYSSIWGNTSTFAQYPYQVHYYLDQLYDNPIPTTGPTIFATPANHTLFNMTVLEGVFANIFQTLAHSDGTTPAQFFTAAQAQSAFNSALSLHGVPTTAVLDLGNPTDRANLFSVIDGAITNLESAAGMKFNATTNSQL